MACTTRSVVLHHCNKPFRRVVRRCPRELPGDDERLRHARSDDTPGCILQFLVEILRPHSCRIKSGGMGRTSTRADTALGDGGVF